MLNQAEVYQALVREIFDGCDHTWILGLDNLELVGNNVPWLRHACKERGIRITGKPKRDLIESLLEWEQRRTVQVMLWGNQRYCQRSGVHMRHIHEAYYYRNGFMIDCAYWCDGRPVAELTV